MFDYVQTFCAGPLDRSGVEVVGSPSSLSGGSGCNRKLSSAWLCAAGGLLVLLQYFHIAHVVHPITMMQMVAKILTVTG